MLSLSLRRKSAPGSLPVGDTTPSPPRRRKPTFSSASSRRSLTSMFAAATHKGESPAKEEFDEVTALEKDHYPLYDADNASHNPQSPASVDGLSNHSPKSRKESRQRSVDSSKRFAFGSRSRSHSGSHSRSTSPPKGLLNTLASKMKAATEFFHKDTSPRGREMSPTPPDINTMTSGKGLSPKKSVRFRSSTSSINADGKSSPIEIPSGKAPYLPPIPLTDALMTNELGPQPSDMVLTARPPETPLLEVMEKRMRALTPIHVPLDLDSKENLLAISGLPTPIPGTTLPMENPVDDHAAISQQEKDALRDFNDAIQRKRQDALPSTQNSLRAEATNNDVEATPSADCESVASTKLTSKEGDYVGDASSLTGSNPFLSSKDGSPSNITPQEGGAKAPASIPVPVSHVKAKDDALSPWTLESRQVRAESPEEQISDANDADSEGSITSGSVRLKGMHAGYGPTHEDIRRKCRAIAPSPTRGESGSSTSADTLIVEGESPPTAITLHPLDNSSGRFVDSHYRCSQSCSALEDDEAAGSGDLDNVSMTDPEKPRPLDASTSDLLPQSQYDLLPEHCVSPLNLKATVSSISPSRSRRAFRFSNRTDEDPEVTSMGGTSFSWDTRKVGENSRISDQTPSPVSIPLPLSVATAKRATACPPETNYRNQYGWSPFDENRFCQAIVAATSVSDQDLAGVLTQKGGLAQFWGESGLPRETAPKLDTQKMTMPEVNRMIQHAHELSHSVYGPNLIEEFKSNQAISFLKRPGLPGNTMGRFAPLRIHRHDYSGEVSTPDGSEDGSSGSRPCSDSDCTVCRVNHHDEAVVPSAKEDLADQQCRPRVCSETQIEKENHGGQCETTPDRPMSKGRMSYVDHTPKQADFLRSIGAVAASPRQKENVRGGSDASESVLSTSSGTGYLMEDEQFARGIV